MDDRLTFQITQTIKEISESDWDALFGPDALEGYGYHKTVEESKIGAFEFGYLLGKRNNETVAILPFFTADFSFTTIVQGPLQKIIVSLRKIFPRFLKTKILFVGFPTAEELYIGISPNENLPPLLDAGLNKLYALCQAKRISIILFYNLSPRHSAIAEYLAKSGFNPMQNFPNTLIDIKARSWEEYMSALSKNTRKDLRRKLKMAWRLENLHTEETDSLEGIVGRIQELYADTFRESAVQFEKLTAEFFQNILRNMPGQAKYFITRANEKIVAFNLCLVKGQTCIDKFIGLDKAVNQKYHLYHATFCHNIQWCIRNGVRFYQMGITGYHPKLRLGAKLMPLHIYVRLFNPVMNFFAKFAVRLIEPARFDPALKNLKQLL